nr:MAG TPA: hypothetical protein [Caudoviricetes sp.]
MHGLCSYGISSARHRKARCPRKEIQFERCWHALQS